MEPLMAAQTREVPKRVGPHDARWLAVSERIASRAMECQSREGEVLAAGPSCFPSSATRFAEGGDRACHLLAGSRHPKPRHAQEGPVKTLGDPVLLSRRR